jgi:hypothetical protein
LVEVAPVHHAIDKVALASQPGVSGLVGRQRAVQDPRVTLTQTPPRRAASERDDVEARSVAPEGVDRIHDALQIGRSPKTLQIPLA